MPAAVSQSVHLKPATAITTKIIPDPDLCDDRFG